MISILLFTSVKLVAVMNSVESFSKFQITGMDCQKHNPFWLIGPLINCTLWFDEFCLVKK